MAGNSKRTIVQLESSAGTGYRYTVTKSRKNHPGRIAVSYTHLTLPTRSYV